MLRPPSPEDDWAAPATATGAAPRTDEVERAFGAMRLVPPPAADDGGAYDRGAAPGVSPAAANAASNGPLDPVLVSCLENPRERLTMLKLEDQIVRFLRNPR